MPDPKPSTLNHCTAWDHACKQQLLMTSTHLLISLGSLAQPETML